MKIKTLSDVADILENAQRTGASEDKPEGTRVITISDTLAIQMANIIREKLDNKVMIGWVRPGWTPTHLNLHFEYKDKKFTALSTVYTRTDKINHGMGAYVNGRTEWDIELNTLGKFIVDLGEDNIIEIFNNRHLLTGTGTVMGVKWTCDLFIIGHKSKDDKIVDLTFVVYGFSYDIG